MQNDFTNLTDNELCQKITLPQSFQELESRYLWLIRLKAKELIKDGRIDVEDLTQEGLLGLYDAATKFDSSQNVLFKTFAGVCIQNRMYNEIRRQSSKNNSLLTNSVSLDEIQFSVPSPESDLERREDFNTVLNQIHISLSVFEQKVLAIYLSGYKRSEIPLRYGISVKAFDNAVQRVRRKLKVKKVI